MTSVGFSQRQPLTILSALKVAPAALDDRFAAAALVDVVSVGIGLIPNYAVSGGSHRAIIRLRASATSRRWRRLGDTGLLKESLIGAATIGAVHMPTGGRRAVSADTRQPYLVNVPSVFLTCANGWLQLKVRRRDGPLDASTVFMSARTPSI